jgi:hypothetical protein
VNSFGASNFNTEKSKLNPASCKVVSFVPLTKELVIFPSDAIFFIAKTQRACICLTTASLWKQDEKQ